MYSKIMFIHSITEKFYIKDKNYLFKWSIQKITEYGWINQMHY